MKKAVIAVMAAVSAVFVFFAVYSGFRKNKAPQYIETVGVIEATEVELSTKIAGRLVYLCCKEGDVVKAGQAVFRLDDAQFKARLEEALAALGGANAGEVVAKAELNTAEAGLNAAEAGVKEAGAQAVRTKALLDEAKKEQDRVIGLFKEGVVTEREFDRAKANYDSFLAEMDSAKARESFADANLSAATAKRDSGKAYLLSSQEGVKGAGARVKLVAAELEDTIVTSPIDGAIVYKAFETGEVISPGVSVYTVHDISNVWARVDIEETNISKIRLGSKAVIAFAGRTPGAGEQAFEGLVIEIGKVGEFATQRDTTRGRPDIRTFRVKAAVKESNGLLKAGMTVTVRIF